MDTGCTLGATAEKDVDCFYDTGLPSRKVFMLPDKTKMTVTKKNATQAQSWAGASKMNIMPNLHTMLISIIKMAEHGHIAVLDKHEARIYNGTTTKLAASGNPIIVAPRFEDTGLWKTELNLDYKILGRKDPDHFIAGIDKANAIFNLPNTRHSLLYYHALAGFPVKESFLDAVRAGNYATWPGLTTTLIAKHFPDLEETQKGHMKGQWKGIWSTKVREQFEIKIELGTGVSPQQPMKKQQNIFVVIYKLAEEVHTNQTSLFPVTSQRGYRYIMVGIHMDANYIFCKLMKNRTENEMIKAYECMVRRMKNSGLGLKKHRLDNECLEKFKMCIKNAGMIHELVPPDCRCCIIAEWAIQTFKNHSVSILSGVDDRFPLSLWCHLVRPAELTVNLLRQSNVTPKVSAYAHEHGQNNYMTRPFASLGCAVMAHIEPKNQQSWDVHVEVGFNIGTAMEHHCCFHVYIVKTRATRVCDAVYFKHQYITNPQITPETLVMKAAAELTSALKGTISHAAETVEALMKVGKLFHKIAAAKAAMAKAKEQRNQHRTHPTAR